MIAQDAGSAFAVLGVRLARAAKALAEARMKQRLLARADDARRWRRAALLWPTISGE